MTETEVEDETREGVFRVCAACGRSWDDMKPVELHTGKPEPDAPCPYCGYPLNSTIITWRTD